MGWYFYDEFSCLINMRNYASEIWAEGIRWSMQQKRWYGILHWVSYAFQLAVTRKPVLKQIVHARLCNRSCFQEIILSLRLWPLSRKTIKRNVPLNKIWRKWKYFQFYWHFREMAIPYDSNERLGRLGYITRKNWSVLRKGWQKWETKYMLDIKITVENEYPPKYQHKKV